MLGIGTRVQRTECLQHVVTVGAGFGGRNPLTVAIRGDYFGSASFGKILGLSTVPMNVLLLISAPLVGWLRDVQGDYTDAFSLMVLTNFAVAYMKETGILGNGGEQEGSMTTGAGG